MTISIIPRCRTVQLSGGEDIDEREGATDNQGSSLLRVGSVATGTIRGIGFIALGREQKVVG